MDYFEKLSSNPYEDLYWNLPETKQKTASVIGGNANNFQNVVRTAEFLSAHYPLSEVQVVLPDSLQKKLPPLGNFEFLPSTDTGSFAGPGLERALTSTSANLLTGDFSKNSLSMDAVASALSSLPEDAPFTLLTRDAIDLVASRQPEPLLLNPNIAFLISSVQLQALLRAVYYPKVFTLSQPLLQAVEVLHKFTLSYPAGLIMLHSGQLLVAVDGKVRAISLEDSGFSPLTLWGGQFASRILALNLYNPGNFLGASVAAVFHRP